MGCVYLVRCEVNEKGYVGKTLFSLAIRREQHEKSAEKEEGFLLHRALRKYGFENFKWMVIFESDDEEELNELEIISIKSMKTKHPNGYNLMNGGQGGDAFANNPRMPEIRRKMREARTPEIIEKLALFHRGRKRSPETRERISRAMKGKKAWNKGISPSPEAIAKHVETYKKNGHVAWNKGKKASLETRLKLSKSQKKRFQSEEERLKLREARKKVRSRKGKKASPEAVEKNRQSHLGLKHTSKQREKNRRNAMKKLRDSKGRFLPKKEERFCGT